MTSLQYGLIGLGNVGSDLISGAIAANLHVHVFDVNDSAVDRAVKLGATRATDAASLARAVDVLVLSLPNGPIVDEVLFEAGVFDALRDGATLIDMSTNRPERAVELEGEGRARGLTVLDAPVSYGESGFVCFVGGDPTTFARASEWFDAVAAHTYHVGAAGQGQYVKLMQNMLTGVYMGAIAEAIGLGARAGVDLSRLTEFLRWTGAHSSLLESTIPRMLEREYGDNGTMAVHAKDMKYALDSAQSVGAPMPFTSALLGVFDEVLAPGDVRWKQLAMIEWFAPSQIDLTQGGVAPGAVDLEQN